MKKTVRQAQIRELYSQGVTLPKDISEASGIPLRTVYCEIQAITKEITKIANTAIFNQSEAEQQIITHKELLQNDLKKILKKMEEYECDEREWATLNARKVVMMNEIEKRSGAEILLKVAEKKAVDSVSEQEQERAKSKLKTASGRALS